MYTYGNNVKEPRTVTSPVCFCQDLAMNGNQKTMELRDKLLEFLPAMTRNLSFYDVAEITKAYQCTGKDSPSYICLWSLWVLCAECYRFNSWLLFYFCDLDHCTSVPTCENGGFVHKGCECLCPKGLKGQRCEEADTDSGMANQGCIKATLSQKKEIFFSKSCIVHVKTWSPKTVSYWLA